MQPLTSVFHHIFFSLSRIIFETEFLENQSWEMLYYANIYVSDLLRCLKFSLHCNKLLLERLLNHTLLYENSQSSKYNHLSSLQAFMQEKKRDSDRWKHCMLSRAWVMVNRANPGGGTTAVKAQHEITMGRRGWEEGEKWKESSSQECLGQTSESVGQVMGRHASNDITYRMVIEWLITYP